MSRQFVSLPDTVSGATALGARARVHLQLVEDPGRAGRNALEERAAELTAWLDGMQVKPRFPSPLSKAVR